MKTSGSPAATHSAAIDPIFTTTPIVNELGQTDYAYYWTSTTHIRFNGSGAAGVYISFGRGLGSMDGTNVIDVHVSRLRSKIDKGFDRPLLHTVRGAGYMLSPD